MADDDDWCESLSLGRPRPDIAPRMYKGNIFEKELPRLADAATYEEYAKQPSLHIEEWLSLLLGYCPRPPNHISYFPSAGLPPNPGESPPAGEDALTWNRLHHGALGSGLALYARYKQVPLEELHSGMLYLNAREFSEFCTRCGLDVPAHFSLHFLPQNLRAPVQHELQQRMAETGTQARTDANGGPEAPRQPEARYKTFALRVAQDLDGVGVRNVTAPMLKAFIESWFAPGQRTVLHRTFQEYLEKWRRAGAGDEALRALLSKILVESGGRPRREDMEDLKRRLPERYAHVEWSDKSAK